MASDFDHLTARFAQALSRLEIDLIGNAKFIRLAAAGPKPGAIWEWNVSHGAEAWTLRIHVALGFPDSPPVVEVVGWNPDRSDRPHIDRKGIVCAIPAATAIDASDPCSLFHYVVGCAEDIVKGTSPEDFRDEFEHYWEKRTTRNAAKVVIVERISDDAEMCACRAWKQTVCVGATDEQVIRWMCGVVGRKPDAFRRLEAVVMRLPKPLIPSEFPDTCADLLRLAEAHDERALLNLRRIILRKHDKFLVLIVQGDAATRSFAAVTLHGLGLAHSKRSDVQSSDPTRPLTTAAQERTARSQCTRHPLRRADPQRIQQRGGGRARLEWKVSTGDRLRISGRLRRPPPKSGWCRKPDPDRQ